MENYDKWKQIVTQGIGRALASRDEPIPGARLRVLISRAANEAGLSYPPVPGQKFKDFLENFREVAEIIEREDQDFVVVPSGRADLLAKVGSTAAGESAQLRKDLYVALTRIQAGQVAWYDPQTDRVSFRSAADASNAHELQLPAATLESERALRQRFTETIAQPAIREELASSLTTERPLTAFSRAVHAARLKAEWHKFRTAVVLTRLREWAQEHGIPWRNTWLVSESSFLTTGSFARAGTARSPQQRIAAFILSLDESELARIQIPADLLMRWLGER